MILTPKHKLLIGIVGVVLVLVAALVLFRNAWFPLSDETTYHGSGFTFVYPHASDAEEYAPGAVVVGNSSEDGVFSPLVEVVRYQSDREVALPPTFDAYVKRQALALCGSDGGVESLSCTDAAAAPYTSAQGLEGQELTLTLLRTNLESGTTTTETFGPIYVFNMTRPVENPEEALRYRALFVYPSFAAATSGSTSPKLLTQIIDSLLIPNGVSSTVGR